MEKRKVEQYWCATKEGFGKLSQNYVLDRQASINQFLSKKNENYMFTFILNFFQNFRLWDKNGLKIGVGIMSVK